MSSPFEVLRSIQLSNGPGQGDPVFDAYLVWKYGPGAKRREPRKTKKWHKRHGYQPHWTATGKLFYSKGYGPFRYERWYR